jgi:hypothetical protein
MGGEGFMFQSRTRRLLAALIGGIMVFSLVYAVAASLNVTSTDLAAGTDTVAGCDANGVTTSYAVAYDGTSGRYEVSSVTVGGIADLCLGQDFSVTLAAGTTSLGTVAQADVSSWTTTSTDANTLALNFSSADVSAAAVTAVFVSASD